MTIATLKNRHPTHPSLTQTLGGGSLEIAAPPELVGRVIAKYQLVSVLGRGGAGTVFLGERADDSSQERSRSK